MRLLSKAEIKAAVPLIPVPLESISHSELVQEQKSHPSVKALFELVSPAGDLETAAQEYFGQRVVLVQKMACSGKHVCRETSCANCGAC